MTFESEMKIARYLQGLNFTITHEVQPIEFTYFLNQAKAIIQARIQLWGTFYLQFKQRWYGETKTFYNFDKGV